MFSVQFRSVREEDCHFKSWYHWPTIGHFETIELAMQTIIKEVYLNEPEATLENFMAVTFVENLQRKFSNEPRYEGEPIYEIIMSSLEKRKWQFRFLKIESPDSPWKIGLNEI